jgi:hypothetical protein
MASPIGIKGPLNHVKREGLASALALATRIHNGNALVNLVITCNINRFYIGKAFKV